jgi:hypothetical protein
MSEWKGLWTRIQCCTRLPGKAKAVGRSCTDWQSPQPVSHQTFSWSLSQEEGSHLTALYPACIYSPSSLMTKTLGLMCLSRFLLIMNIASHRCIELACVWVCVCTPCWVTLACFKPLKEIHADHQSCTLATRLSIPPSYGYMCNPPSYDLPHLYINCF